jgi:hypothetical protein
MPRVATQGHQRIEGRTAACLDRRQRQFVRVVERTGRIGLAQIENLGADRHADAKIFDAAAPTEHAIGQVLDRKVVAGRIGGFDPAAQLDLVRFVELEHHGRSGLKCFLRSDQQR